MQDLPTRFKNYLAQSSVSQKTFVNYVSDLTQFLRWAENRLSDRNILRHFSTKLVNEYKDNLAQDNVPPATTNRRLSTLRLFGRFAQEEGLIGENPTESIENLPNTHLFQKVLLQKFEENLRKEGVRDTKIRTHLDNAQEFLRFLRAE